MDVDLVIALDSENVDHFVGAARELGLNPILPVSMADLADSKKRTGITQRHLGQMTGDLSVAARYVQDDVRDL